NLWREKCCPNQFPISFPHGRAIRFDVVYEIVAGARPPLTDCRPNINTVERFISLKPLSGETGEGRVHIDDMHHLVYDSGIYSPGPVRKRNHPRSAFVNRALAVAIWAVVRRQFTFHCSLADEQI